MSDRYPARLGDVPVFVDSSELTGGRRVVSDEYPYRDDPWTDDMGRKQRVYTLHAFLLNDNGDIQQQREALLRVLESAGTTTIVHPRFGHLRVQLGEYTLRFSARTNREDVSVKCLQPGDTKQPQVATNTLSAVNRSVALNIDTHMNTFANRFTLDAAPQFVKDDALNQVRTGLAQLRSLSANVQGVLSPVSEVAALIGDIDSTLDSLINTPLALANNLNQAIGQTTGLFSTIDHGLSGLSAINRLFASLEPVPNASANTALFAASHNTPSRQQQQQNRTAVANAFSRLALTHTVQHMATLASGIAVEDVSQSPFSSYNEAQQVRDQLAAQIDADLLIADDTTYAALQALQHSLHAHIEAHGINLPRFSQITMANTQPALVMAYRLYGDASRAADIVERNAIRNAVFVEKNQQLVSCC